MYFFCVACMVFSGEYFLLFGGGGGTGDATGMGGSGTVTGSGSSLGLDLPPEPVCSFTKAIGDNRGRKAASIRGFVMQILTQGRDFLENLHFSK